MKSGRLIAFEGIDGSGKSTQVARFERACRVLEPLVTREPTDGPWGQRIRAMARSAQPVAAKEELSWFLEDRRAHVREVIRPALQAGRLVVTDRYFLSTVAYQGARGLDPEHLLALNEAEFPLPDLALLLVVDPVEGLRRANARPDADEPAFEVAAFLERVAAVFAAIERPYVVRIDAARQPDAVERSILDTTRQRLSLP